MKFVIKLQHEITIKSDSARRRAIKLLSANIRNILRSAGLQVGVRGLWDKLSVNVRVEDESQADKIRQTSITLLQNIPGIERILEVQESAFTDLDDMFEQVKAIWQHKLADKRFAVRVKRKGKHPFTSTQAAAYVGGGLNQHCQSAGVDLKHPDIQVELEIENDQLRLIKQSHAGLGGLPLPTQEDVLSLISGGFDSGVASYELIRRGARTHYCFFNLGGREHEMGVRAISHYLWRTYSQSHSVKFIAIDFTPMLNQIVERVDAGLMGVVLKRIMLKTAERVAEQLNIDALLTGEALGQVASQTMSNLQVIDRATHKLVLRPLIARDKDDIIQVARKIGVEDFAKAMAEYCAVISRNPTVKADLDAVEQEETKLDMQLIDSMVQSANIENIRHILKPLEKAKVQTGYDGLVVKHSDQLEPDAVVIDIRSIDEQEASPLALEHNTVLHIPFFKLQSQYPQLDHTHTYYLYCQRGEMSQLQALLLQEQGFTNIAVYFNT